MLKLILYLAPDSKTSLLLYQKFKSIFTFHSVIYSPLILQIIAMLARHSSDLPTHLLESIYSFDSHLFLSLIPELPISLYHLQPFHLQSNSILQEFLQTPLTTINQCSELFSVLQSLKSQSPKGFHLQRLSPNLFEPLSFKLHSTYQLQGVSIVFNEATEMKMGDSNFYRNHRNFYFYIECSKMCLRHIEKVNAGGALMSIFDSVFKMLSKTIWREEQPCIHNSLQFYRELNEWKFIYALCSPLIAEIIIKSCPHICENMVVYIRKRNLHPLVRQYVEVVICRLYRSIYMEYRQETRQHFLTSILTTNDVDMNVCVPLLLTLGYEMIWLQQSKIRGFEEPVQKIFESLIRFISCHHAYVRSICQYYLMKMVEMKEQTGGLMEHLGRKVWKEDKDCVKIMRNVGIVVQGFKEAVESQQIQFLGFQRVQQFPSKPVLSQLHSDFIKILKFIHQQFHNHKIVTNLICSKVKKLEEKIEEEKQCGSFKVRIKEPQIIIIATLLEKIHNFSHILKTLHHLGSRAMLVVPSNQSLQIPPHSQISIICINPNQLLKFISLQKKRGFPLIALQQCAGSVKIEEYDFPTKYMLLLGNERKGASSLLLKQADALVEIPQYGKVRSLNVHVSMAICLWQSLQSV